MKLINIKTTIAVLALALLSLICVTGAQADSWNKKTVMTFSQPVEIPGQILPAGTYTIKLVDLASERHIVQFLEADGIHVVATVLAINNWRLHPTGETVVKFAERSGDRPEALKAWFYPGDNFGQEFVYPRQRAIQLAIETKEPIPAIAEETPTAELKTAPVVAITPEQKEVPLTEAIAVTEPVTTEPVTVAKETSLPKTASMLPLIALLGLVCVLCALVLKRYAVQLS